MKFFSYICNCVALDTGMCDIKINYDGALTRPYSFNVNYTIDGEPFSQIIKQQQL